MNELRATVIRSRRTRLLAYAAAAVVAGGAAGWLLEISEVLATSLLGKLGASTGLPVAAIAVAAIAGAVAFALVKDDWNSTVTLDATAMHVRDHLGQYSLPYSDIGEVKAVPMGGVVLRLDDPDRWLASASGDRGIRRRAAGLVQRRYGGHVLFSSRQISIGAAKFIELVRGKMKAGG
jgi:hypothetical protein